MQKDPTTPQEQKQVKIEFVKEEKLSLTSSAIKRKKNVLKKKNDDLWKKFKM